MLSRFAKPRMMLWPTVAGWCLLGGTAVVGALGLGLGAEPFLARTVRLDADTLIIEGWMHEDGAEAGAGEFLDPTRNYHHVVVAGGLTGGRGTRQRWREVEIGDRELRRAGVKPAAIVQAETDDRDKHRTFRTAVAARDALEKANVRPLAINVFTRGVHARRSRLIYERVFGPSVKVGVVSWSPRGYETQSWWQSSERSVDLLKESVGYLYEALLYSGRAFDSREPQSVATTR